MREAYFHEDDYCQTELLPIANLQHCRDQLGEIESFSAQHKSEFGWTDMYVRPDAPQTLADCRITLIELQRVLGQFLPTFDRVMTGYSTYKKPCQNTIAFGADTNLILFAAHDGEFIITLWLTIFGLSEHDAELASRVLKQMSQWRLLLVDWSMSALVALNETDAVERYLAEFRASDDS